MNAFIRLGLCLVLMAGIALCADTRASPSWRDLGPERDAIWGGVTCYVQGLAQCPFDVQCEMRFGDSCTWMYHHCVVSSGDRVTEIYYSKASESTFGYNKILEQYRPCATHYFCCHDCAYNEEHTRWECVSCTPEWDINVWNTWPDTQSGYCPTGG